MTQGKVEQFAAVREHCKALMSSDCQELTDGQIKGQSGDCIPAEAELLAYLTLVKV